MDATPDTDLAVTVQPEASLPLPGGPETALHALERMQSLFASDRTLVRNGGYIDEVSPSHYRVRGVSGAARPGDVVQLRSTSGVRSGAIVRIGPSDVLVAPY